MTGSSLLDSAPMVVDGGHPLTFSYADLVVTVSSAAAAPLKWLDHFLRPWFAPGAAGRTVAAGMAAAGKAVATVELLIGAAENTAERSLGSARHLEEAPCFLLDSGIVSHPIVVRRGSELVVADGDLGVTYMCSPGRVSIETEADDSGARIALMRVVREMAVSHARMRGRPLLHTAVAALPGGAIAFCGPKRSGKTSLLLHALSMPGARFVANDRAIAIDDGSAIAALGMPTITALRADSVARFPRLLSALRGAPDRHWLTPAETSERVARPWSDPASSIDLSPARLCELIGVEPARQERLGVLVFPTVDASASGIALRRLTRAETLPRLRAGLVGAMLDERPMSVFVPRDTGAPEAPEGPAANEEAVLERLASLPAYEALLGPDAYASSGLPDAVLHHVA